MPIWSLPPERSRCSAGSPVVGTHPQPMTRKTLSSENYRGKHHIQFFRHSTRFEVLTVLNPRKSS